MLQTGAGVSAVHVNLAWIAQRGTIKGMHMQRPPSAEIKIVTCLKGRIFDVAVDLRPESKTFGVWFVTELSPDEPTSVLIPEGCAHGMQCLEDDSLVHYIHSAPYDPKAECGINPLDSEVGVPWPLEPHNISQRDQSLPGLADLQAVAQ